MKDKVKGILLYQVNDQNTIQIVSKAYVHEYRLSSLYNAIYLDTFYETLKEGNKQLLEKIITKTTEGNNISLIDMNLTILDYFSSNYDL